MRTLSFCFLMHAPYRLKRYRFFDIGQDHYYYDDMQSEEHMNWLVNTSYKPLLCTVKDMVEMSHGKFHCAFAISGVTLELLEQHNPEIIDLLKELVATKAVELVATPYGYSFAAEYAPAEFAHQLEREAAKIEEIFGTKPTTLWNTELLYNDEIGEQVAKLGYKAVMMEGAKQLLSWRSANYVYQSAAAKGLKLLMRNGALSDEMQFHFSDPQWYNFPMDAEKYANQIAAIEGEEPVVNLWMPAEAFGVLQNAGTGIFDFLKALPYFCLERQIGFATPAEAVKKNAASEVIPVPYATTWCGEGKDLSMFNGNDLQHEALEKLYAVTERVRLCKDIALRRDWYVLQSADHFRYMNHVDAGNTSYESAYDAFINYMNILSDFLLRVEEQYPTTIENEELNELLKTINNQEAEISRLEKELAAAKKATKVAAKPAEAKPEKPTAKKVAPAKKAAKK